MKLILVPKKNGLATKLSFLHRAKPAVVQFKLPTKRNEVCAKELEYS